MKSLTSRERYIRMFHGEPIDIDYKSIGKMKKLIGEEGIVSPSFYGPSNIIAHCYCRPDDLLLAHFDNAL